MSEYENLKRIARTCLVLFLFSLSVYYFFGKTEKKETKSSFLFYTQDEISKSYKHYILVEGFYGRDILSEIACRHYDTCRFFQPIESITFVNLKKSKAYYLTKEEGTSRIKENTLISISYNYKALDRRIEKCPPIDSVVVENFKGSIKFINRK